jgi:hypothetical protein
LARATTPPTRPPGPSHAGDPSGRHRGIRHDRLRRSAARRSSSATASCVERDGPPHSSPTSRRAVSDPPRTRPPVVSRPTPAIASTSSRVAEAVPLPAVEQLMIRHQFARSNSPASTGSVSPPRPSRPSPARRASPRRRSRAMPTIRRVDLGGDQRADGEPDPRAPARVRSSRRSSPSTVTTPWIRPRSTPSRRSSTIGSWT